MRYHLPSEIFPWGDDITAKNIHENEIFILLHLTVLQWLKFYKKKVTDITFRLILFVNIAISVKRMTSQAFDSPLCSNDIETNRTRIYSVWSIILYYCSRPCNSTYAEGNSPNILPKPSTNQNHRNNEYLNVYLQ